MNIRAKMVCDKVEKVGNTEQVAFHAVYGGSDENKSFAQATPSASLSMSIDNPTAQGAFEKGKEYYVDITPAS